MLVLSHKLHVFVSLQKFCSFPGRAGRRNSLYPKGFVGTRAPGDFNTVLNAVRMPLDQLSTPAAGLFPEFQHLELLAGQVYFASRLCKSCLHDKLIFCSLV